MDATPVLPEQIHAALTQLSVSCLRFELTMRDPLNLPPFYVSLLRGGLGYRFRKLVCVQPQIANCRDCALLRQCAYPYVFQTPLPAHIQNAPHLQEVSPYVLRMITPSGQLAAGDSLIFDLLLFGKAIGYLPYFVIGYRQLGIGGGFGREQVRFDLNKVVDITPTSLPNVLYSGESSAIHLAPSQITLDKLVPVLSNQPQKLSLLFETPTRIKRDGKITDLPVFPDLMAALLRRLAQLLIVHGNGQWEVSEEEIIRLAQSILQRRSTLKWIDWSRFSSRQKQGISMAGVIGELEVEGDFSTLFPLLWAGQYLHVGRGATFGNGQYQVRIGMSKPSA